MKHILLFFGIGSLLCGIGFSALGITFINDAENNDTWRITTGTVVHASIETRKKNTKPNAEKEYFPHIEYRYVIEGATHTCARVYYNAPCSERKADITKYIEQYPSGKVVQVYVSPENPSAAVLRRSAHIGELLPLGFGVAFIIIGAFLIVSWALRMMQTT